MRDRGDTLITVPCWWDGSVASLKATINLHRRDLFVGDAKKFTPIPSEPPAGFFVASKLPHIGELMLSVFVPNSHFSPTDWWIGEKYDGIRACWVESTLDNIDYFFMYSPHGKQLVLPVSFASKLPSIFLDGEIWFGRGEYKQAAIFSKIHYSENLPPHWDHLRYLAFDCPSPSLFSSPFESRFESVLSHISYDHTFLGPVSMFKCSGRRHMTLTVKAVADLAGEGVVLRLPLSPYSHGRSDSFLKLKIFKDQEALVVGRGADDTYLLKLPTEKELEALLASTYEGDPPQKGDIVTFATTHFAKSKKPKFPRIFRIRSDLAWVDVLESTFSTLRRNQMNETTQRALGQGAGILPHGHWTVDGSINVRRFFEQIAKERNFDPLEPEPWYQVTRKFVHARKGGGSVLGLYDGSLVRALLDLYPNIGLEPHKFNKSPQSHWYHSDNRKKFFLSIADKMKFDPLLADNWYSLSLRHIAVEKGGISILNRYGGSYSKAVLDLFPDIGLVESRFNRIPENYWKDRTKRKNYFDQYAKLRAFDPLVMANWYAVHINAFKRSRSGASILKYYNNSMADALVDIYPNTGFSENAFTKKPYKYWSNPNNARKFFNDFAQKHGFDPLVADSWYSVSLRSVHQEKAGVYVVGTYQGSLIKALMTLYPNIGLSIKGFRRYPKSYWDLEENRKSFFEGYAKSKGFDPLIANNWYSISGDDIQKEKGGVGVLGWYSRSLSKALTDLYPNIGLDHQLFYRRPQNFWQEKSNQRKFFDLLARKKHFNPLLPSSWYNITHRNIVTQKGGFSVLAKYSGSVIEALVDLYPEISFDKSKFVHMSADPVLRNEGQVL